MHQQKLDGVPTRIMRVSQNEYRAVTRQGETLRSIDHIVKEVSQLDFDIGGSIIGELYIEGAAFKAISGKVRGHANYAPLRLHVFDFDVRNDPELQYAQRRFELLQRTDDYYAGAPQDDRMVRLIPGVIVHSMEAAEEAHDALMLANPTAEGSVLHDINKPFQPGKRCWGTQRMKPVPTIDLRIVSFEEAVSEAGKRLGMVGRLNAEFTSIKDGRANMDIIGIGPGALTHQQRKALWATQQLGRLKPTIAEIRYMRDETYDALRQPTFRRWRTDKQVADVLDT
jgi:ATP-dependent DNA ligase